MACLFNVMFCENENRTPRKCRTSFRANQLFLNALTNGKKTRQSVSKLYMSKNTNDKESVSRYFPCFIKASECSTVSTVQLNLLPPIYLSVYTHWSLCEFYFWLWQVGFNVSYDRNLQNVYSFGCGKETQTWYSLVELKSRQCLIQTLLKVYLNFQS